MTIREMRQLKPGWDSYGAEPPNNAALRNLARIIRAATGIGINITALMPSADGGAGMCCVANGRYGHVEASNDGDITAAMYSNETEPVITEIASDVGLRQTLAAIQQFVYA